MKSLEEKIEILEEAIVKSSLEIRLEQIKQHNEIKEILYGLETYLKNRLDETCQIERQ